MQERSIACLCGKNTFSDWAISFKEVRLQICLEDVSRDTLDGIIERQDMYGFSVRHRIGDRLHGDDVSKFDAEVGSNNFIHSNLVVVGVLGKYRNPESQ